MRALIWVVLVSLASPAWPQGSEWALQRQVELPAHRSLMATVDAASPVPFETDGCSGGLSLAWRSVAGAFPDLAAVHEGAPPWEACCVRHDGVYHTADSTVTADASFDARLAADVALRACVIAEGKTRRAFFASEYGVAPETVTQAYLAVAEAMFVAVRFGGGPCTGLPWRWGYGYPQCTPVSVGRRNSSPQ